MPRWRSSGAASMDAKSRATVLPPASARTLVIAAVRVVLPWSMCPIVPTLRCGFERSNLCFAIWVISLRALGVDDLARDRLGHVFVTVELHRERGPTLAHRAQVGGVSEHLGERDTGLDLLAALDLLEVLDAAATGAEVPHHVAEVVVWRLHLDGHHRLEQLRLRALQRLLERHGAGDLEGALARVDLVVGALDELHLDVDDGIAGEDARVHRLLDTSIDARDVLLGYLPADDLVRDRVPLARRLRLDVDHGVAVLARAAGLADEL